VRQPGSHFLSNSLRLSRLFKPALNGGASLRAALKTTSALHRDEFSATPPASARQRCNAAPQHERRSTRSEVARVFLLNDQYIGIPFCVDARLPRLLDHARVVIV